MRYKKKLSLKSLLFRFRSGHFVIFQPCLQRRGGQKIKIKVKNKNRAIEVTNANVFQSSSLSFSLKTKMIIIFALYTLVYFSEGTYLLSRPWRYKGEPVDSFNFVTDPDPEGKFLRIHRIRVRIQ